MKIKLYTMRKIVLILSFLMLSIITIKAQNTKREKIKLLKISYITNAISLSPEEAEKFWPVYNLYTKKIQKLKVSLERGIRNEIQETGGIENISNSQAQKIIERSLTLEQEITSNKIALYRELSNIVPPKKVLMLKKAERDFNRRILQEYGKRRRIQQRQ